MSVPEEPPPFATWPVLYGVVIGALILLIVALAWMTRAFA